MHATSLFFYLPIYEIRAIQFWQLTNVIDADHIVKNTPIMLRSIFN